MTLATRTALLFCIATWGTGMPTALAQDEDYGGHYAGESIRVDPRSVAEDWLILPEGTFTVGSQLRFLTAEGGFGGDRVRFTDAVLMDLNGRASINGKADVFAGTTLLPKQPSSTGETVWQGIHLGGRLGFGKRYAAVLQGEVGPLLGHGGHWLVVDTGIEARKRAHRTLYFQGSLRGAGTVLLPKAGENARAGFGEVVVDGQLVYRAPRALAAWLGTQFRFPVATFNPRVGTELEPQTRVNFRAGMALSYIDGLDIYGEYSVTDRGELRDAATRLPILDGGFDQNLLALGVVFRFDERH